MNGWGVGRGGGELILPSHSFISRSSLLNPAAWMKGITPYLNNSAQHVAPLRPAPPPTAASETSHPPPLSLLFVLLFIASLRRVIAVSAAVRQRRPPSAVSYLFGGQVGKYLPAILSV